MRKTCLEAVYELAKNDDRIFFIGSDLGYGTLQQFKDEMPERFFMEGVNEANVVGVATGLALEGKIVYVNTIATFLTRRCYEQVVLDMCLHQANVRLIGNGGGLVYAPLGPTHLAVEDIAIMRALPNMTVLAPADASEMKRLMPGTVDHKGPIYIRLGKGYDPIVTPPDIPFEIGKAIPIREGDDVLIITTGIALGLVREAAAKLADEGIDTGVLHLPSIKPLDIATVVDWARRVRAVVTVEEHSVIGGLASSVAHVIMNANFDNPVRFGNIGIPDAFSEKYGSQASLMAEFGITSEGVESLVRKLL